MTNLIVAREGVEKKYTKSDSFITGSILRNKIFLLVMTALTLFFQCSSLYASDIPTSAEIENLKKRIQRLEGEKEKEEVALTLGTAAKHITFNGVVEIEANYTKEKNVEETSDIVLATAQLGVDFHINKYVGGHIVLLHEEGETEPVEVDEANITIFKPLRDEGRIGIVAGRIYLPFGAFNSAMITDPLTVDLAETNNTALQFLYESKYLEFSTAVFSGETDAVGDNDHVDTVVASVNIKPTKMVTFGGYFMSDMAESDNGLVTDSSFYNDSVSGAGGFFSLDTGVFTFNVEYITALDSFDPAVVAVGEDLTGSDPEVWMIEAGLIPLDSYGVALRYEEAKDFMDDISRYGGVVSYNIFDETVLSLEYLLEDPDTGGDDIHSVTVQLAIEF